MKIPCRKYLFQLHPWPFMCTSMIISSWENSEENVIFLPCFSTEFARYYLTGNKQKIARRTVYFSTSVRPVMFRLWHDHCTSPTLSRKLHLFFYRTHKVLDDTLLSTLQAGLCPSFEKAAKTAKFSLHLNVRTIS